MTDWIDHERKRMLDEAEYLFGKPAPRSLSLDELLFWASNVFVALAVGSAIGAAGAVFWSAFGSGWQF